MRVLVGDIGGTNARLALVERVRTGRGWSVLEERHFPSQEYEGLVPVLKEFLAGASPSGRPPERAVLGVAGPVSGGKGRLPNRGWLVDEEEIVREVEVSDVRVLNDFQVIGYALPTLSRDDLFEVHAGSASPPEDHPPIALIGAGTGLGQGFLVWNGVRYEVHPSEGGHAEFAPRTPTELGLLEHLWETHSRVSCEDVVSGRGLVNLYRYFLARDPGRENDATRRAIEEGDPPKVIVERALAGSDSICESALDLFVSAYGAQAGNVALTVRAAGGVYLAGGIAPAITDRLRSGGFVRAFKDKGPLSELVARIPVRVILDTRVGLRGAMAIAGTDF